MRRTASREAAHSDPEGQADQAVHVIESALGRIHSEEDAERVIDELERRTAGRTQAYADATPTGPPVTVEREVRRAGEGEDKAVAALQATVEQTTGPQTAGSRELGEAVEEAMSQPEESVEAHEYLRRAVLKRMTPLQAWDASLYIFVNRLQHSELVTRAMRAASTLAWHGAAWGAAALVLAALDPRRGRVAAREMIPALLVTNTLVERVIKKYFRRRRPFITLVQAMVVGRKPGSWSFPSGHSATSFACASALGARYPRRRPILYGLASLVAFSRVYLGHHYPSDVLSGATIGEGLSRLVVWAVRRARR